MTDERSTMAEKEALVPMEEIDHILLDLDGTLLDRYFDDYFWEHLVPESYAERNDISFGRAKEIIYPLYRRHEGTLNWADLDFWSRELDLDMPALKEQIRHLVDIHPHVEDFLINMKDRGKELSLLTNAHMKAIEIKFKKTGIGRYFDHVVASFDMGHPKEEIEFWEKVERRLGFDRERSVFVDDTEEILRTARSFGIKWLIHKSRASSRAEEKKSNEFPSISDFRELMK